MRANLWLFSMALITLACSPMEKELKESLPDRWPNAVTYEIFVQSFADSDGDGTGNDGDLRSTGLSAGARVRELGRSY